MNFVKSAPRDAIQMALKKFHKNSSQLVSIPIILHPINASNLLISSLGRDLRRILCKHFLILIGFKYFPNLSKIFPSGVLSNICLTTVRCALHSISWHGTIYPIIIMFWPQVTWIMFLFFFKYCLVHLGCMMKNRVVISYLYIIAPGLFVLQNPVHKTLSPANYLEVEGCLFGRMLLICRWYVWKLNWPHFFCPPIVQHHQNLYYYTPNTTTKNDNVHLYLCSYLVWTQSGWFCF